MDGRNSRKHVKNVCVMREKSNDEIPKFLSSRPWIRVQVRRTLRPEEILQNFKDDDDSNVEPLTVFKVEWDEDLVSYRDFLSEVSDVMSSSSCSTSKSRFEAAVDAEMFLGEVIELDVLYQLLLRHGIPESKLQHWKTLPSSLRASLDTLGFSACERKLLLLSSSSFNE